MHLYNLLAYGSMLNDSTRVDAYAESLRHAIEKDAIVIDIGTGAGFFAFLACQLGAKRVYAIEPNPGIHVAKQIANTYGLKDRIKFIQDYSQKIELPEPADVVLEDMRGMFPWNPGRMAAITDARNRFLKPSGTLITQRDRFSLSLVCIPQLYQQSVIQPWSQNDHSLDMRAAHRYIVNQIHRPRLKAEHLFDRPQSICTLDYATIEDPNLSATVEWTVSKSGVAHGFTTWFEAQLAGGFAFSTMPAAESTVYGTPFFPWPQPLELAPGDVVFIDLRATLAGDYYDWRWETRVYDQGNKNPVKAHFKQGTMLSRIITPAEIRKGQPDYRPVLNNDAETRRLILNLMDGNHTVREIAQQLHQAFPNRFGSMEDAMPEVISFSQRFSR